MDLVLLGLGLAGLVFGGDMLVRGASDLARRAGLPPLVAGTLGGLLATWVTFVPCFLWIFLGAPFIEQLRGNAAVAGALSAITAATGSPA